MEDLVSKKDFSIKLGPDIQTKGHILVCGGVDSGKSELLRNMGDIYTRRKIETELYTAFPLDGTRSFKETFITVKDLAQVMQNYDNLLNERMTQMADAHVGFYHKAGISPKVIIINLLDEYMDSDNYRAADIIKSAITRITRIGYKCGILTVISVVRASNFAISTAIKSCIDTTICTSAFDDTSSALMFGGKDLSNLYAPAPDKGVIFTTDDVTLRQFTKSDIIKYN